MRLSIISTISTLVSLTLAQSTSNPFKVSPGFSVTAGQPTTIQWTPTTQGPVSLTLRSGNSGNLAQGSVIASSIPNSGSYTFTVPGSTAMGSDYTLQIAPVSNPNDQNFTPQFTLQSSSTGNSASASGATSAMSAPSTGSMASQTSASTSAVSSATQSGSSMTTTTTPKSGASSATGSSTSSSGSKTTSGSTTGTSSTPSSVPSSGLAPQKVIVGRSAVGLAAALGAAVMVL